MYQDDSTVYVQYSYDLCDAMKIVIRWVVAYCRYNSSHNSAQFSIFTMYNNLDCIQAAALEEEENMLVAPALVSRDKGQRRRQRQRQTEV